MKGKQPSFRVRTADAESTDGDGNGGPRPLDGSSITTGLAPSEFDNRASKIGLRILQSCQYLASIYLLAKTKADDSRIQEYIAFAKKDVTALNTDVLDLEQAFRNSQWKNYDREHGASSSSQRVQSRAEESLQNMESANDEPSNTLIQNVESTIDELSNTFTHLVTMFSRHGELAISRAASKFLDSANSLGQTIRNNLVDLNESVAPAAPAASATTTPARQAPVAAAPSQVASNTSTSNLDDWGWEDSEYSDDETYEAPSGIERLPSDLLQAIISRTSPRDVLQIAMLPDFRHDAYSDTVWKSLVPSPLPLFADCEFNCMVARLLIEQSNVDHLDLDLLRAIISLTSPSMTFRELFGLLTQHQVVADQSMAMWLDKETGAKCYMLLARTLLGANQSNWKWISCGSLRFHGVAAELLPSVNQLEISGKMPSNLLSQSSTYAAYMVFKVKDNSTGLDLVQESVVSIGAYRDANEICFCPAVHKVYGNSEFPLKWRDGWMEIKLGEFQTGDGDDGQLHVQVMLRSTGNQVMKGLIMLGIEIRVAKWRASPGARDHEKA